MTSMIALFISVLLTCHAALGQQEKSASDYRVAYQVTGGSPEIWVKDLQSPKGKRLVKDARQPAWSPDGKRIAYVHVKKDDQGELVLANADGSNPKVLFAGGGSPAWSPDGKQIAFIFRKDKKGPANVGVLDVERGDTRTITNLKEGEAARRPTWAPDGKRLAIAIASKDENGLAIVEVSSGTITQLTRHAKRERVGGYPVEDADPAWSPDGEWIAFASNREGNFGIFLMRPDGSDIHSLLVNSQFNFFRPVWEPDEKRLAFEMELDQGAMGYDKHGLGYRANYTFPGLLRSEYPLPRGLQVVDLVTHDTEVLATGTHASFGKP